MVLAVLEAHGGAELGQHDVYLNVAGGLRISEPAADLAAAAALVSSLLGRAAAARHGLFRRDRRCPARSGRSPMRGARLKEAAKLGFGRAVAPAPARRHEASAMPVRLARGSRRRHRRLVAGAAPRVRRVDAALPPAPRTGDAAQVVPL